MMLKNFRLRNLVIQNRNNTKLDETDRFVNETIRLARFHVEGINNRIRQGVVTEERAAVIRLDDEHSLLMHVKPELKNNPHFFDYNNLTGELSQEMDYEHFKEMNTPGRLAYFEFRMDKIHLLDMSPLLRPGTMDSLNELYDMLDEEEEVYEIGY